MPSRSKTIQLIIFNNPNRCKVIAKENNNKAHKYASHRFSRQKEIAQGFRKSENMLKFFVGP